MRRYKNILVAVDGSQASFHALEESIRLAQWGKGGATVIHVAPFYEGDLSLVGVKNIKAAVDGLGGPILQEAMDIAELHKFSVNTILTRGEIHESIARQALMQDADLIVLGARRTSFIARLFAGRVLREVTALSSKDVLVIPHQTTIGWDKVLFPINSSTNNLEAAVRVIEVAVTYGAELSILLVTKAFLKARRKTLAGDECLGGKCTVQYLEDIHMEAERAGVKSESRVVSGRFPRVVNEIARERHASMIAMGLHKRTKSAWRFGRNSIVSIVHNSPCPVLLLRNSTG
jgi:nucleotide-binding universal stress UspA family protein